MNRPLRILATAFDYRPKLGGVATLSYELFRAMKELPGIELRLIAPQAKGALELDATSGIDTHRIRLSHSATIGAMKSVLPLSDSLIREVVSWSPSAILNLLWLPDGMASLVSSPVRAWKGIPYFVYVHGVEVIESQVSFKKRMRSALGPMKCAVLRSAAGLFTGSDFTRQQVMKACGLGAEKIHLAPPGADSQAFFPEAPASDLIQKHGLRGRKVFLTVSRLQDYKGLDRAIAAIARIKDRHPEVMYLICGEGQDRPRLESLVRHYRVQSHVTFAGAVPLDRLRDYYNLADTFVLLSREDWETPNIEGFGIVFIEAAACAKPSIGGRSGGIPEAVGGEDYGWLVDPEDPAAIARAMVEALENPQRVQAKGLAARERMLESYTWKIMAETVVERIRVEVATHVRN